ncbi:MAG: DUF2232 domain-containing protein [Clostridia bacterium]|nr:DUF2232 domain-containing protein [Clostridia bacterium]
MKHPLIAVRSVKSAVIGSLLVIIPYALLLPGRDILGPLPAVYAVMLTAILLPTALCLITMVCGTAPMLVAVGAAMSVLYTLMGVTGFALSALYVLPILAAFLVIMRREVPFKKSCPIMIGVHVAALAAVFAVCQRLTGGDLYNAAGNAVADFLKQWDMGDLLLYEFYSMGLIDLRESLRDNALQSSLYTFALSDAAREDMLLSVRTMITGQLQMLIPNLIVTQSIQGGVACLLLPLRFGYLAEEKRAFRREEPVGTPGEKQAVDFPTLDMPPFQTWHLPRGIGWQVGAALVGGYVLRLSGTFALRIAGIMLYGAASSIFVIQGAAFINFMQKQRGTKRFWRVLVPLLLMTTPFLMFIGIFDQLNNVRGLRKPPEPKEDIFP